jgi:hypothetical protein
VQPVHLFKALFFFFPFFVIAREAGWFGDDGWITAGLGLLAQ